MTDLQTILQAVSDATGISEEEMRERSRKSEIVEARQIYCYLAKGYSLSRVGRKINRGHSTVIHGVKKIKDLLSINDKRTMELIEKIKTPVLD